MFRQIVNHVHDSLVVKEMRIRSNELRQTPFESITKHGLGDHNMSVSIAAVDETPATGTMVTP